MQAKADNRNQFVDIMRGIAMLLVVLGHSMTGCTVDSQRSFLFNIIWSLQMPLFILISGYVTKYSRPISDGKGLWKYVKRRTVAYMLPWAVWSFVVRGIIFGENGFLNVKHLLWNMDSGYWFLATIWTISMIFGIASFIAERLGKESVLKNQIGLLGCYLAGMVLLVGVGAILGLSFFAIKLTLYYMPFYYAGFLYGQFDDRMKESEIGKKIIDSVVAICFVVWLFVILRFSLYEMSDGGFAIILRAATSLAGCIAVCGLCRGIFSSKMGTSCMGRRALVGSVSHALSASQLDQVGQSADSVQSSRAKHGSGQLLDYGGTYCDGNSDDKPKCRDEIYINRKEKVSEFFLWAGKQSLEIYMMHGLLLNIFKSSVAIQFSSIEGYLLTAGNFALTIGLCAVVIRLLKQNFVLK
ncbi:acyltransferase, partial [Phocaeicola vulgatus]